MTVEQLAEKWVDEWGICCRAENMNANQFAKQAYIAGYNEAQNTITQCNRSALSGVKWHKVADGDLPKENEYIMIYSKLADNIAVGKRRCAGKIRKRCMYEWYFATYEGTYCLRDKDIIAWKEIDCKEIKEND